MILGQLTMGARQTKNAPLLMGSTKCDLGWEILSYLKPNSSKFSQGRSGKPNTPERSKQSQDTVRPSRSKESANPPISQFGCARSYTPIYSFLRKVSMLILLTQFPFQLVQCFSFRLASLFLFVSSTDKYFAKMWRNSQENGLCLAASPTAPIAGPIFGSCPSASTNAHYTSPSA